MSYDIYFRPRQYKIYTLYIIIFQKSEIDCIKAIDKENKRVEGGGGKGGGGGGGDLCIFRGVENMRENHL